VCNFWYILKLTTLAISRRDYDAIVGVFVFCAWDGWRQNFENRFTYLKGNCSKKILLQNMFGFRIYTQNIYVKLSTETVIS